MNRRTVTAIVLAYLVPGAGHFYLGRRGRALAFFAIILCLFVVGLSIDGRLYTVQQGNVLTLLATLGSIGTGLPYFLARALGEFGDVTSITYEYGSAFTLTAGLMNLLLIVDAFDIAEGGKE
jgi:TM2 domain-containing membrane protein YozV